MFPARTISKSALWCSERCVPGRSPSGRPVHLRRSDRSRQGGFTLVELSIVLALLAISASLVIPQLGQLTDANVKAQARYFQGTMEYATTQAVARRRPHRLYIDLDKGTYWIAAQGEYGRYRALENDPLGKERPLRDGVILEDVFVVDTIYKKGVTYIEFLPDGTMDPALIHLTTDDKVEYTVIADEFTGLASVDVGHLDPKEYSRTEPKVARDDVE